MKTERSGEFFVTFALAYFLVGLPVSIVIFPLVGIELNKAQQWSVPAIVAAVFALGFSGGFSMGKTKDQNG